MASETDADRAQAPTYVSGTVIWAAPAVVLLGMLLVAWAMKLPILHLLDSEAVVHWDTTVLQWFQARATPTRDNMAVAISLVGSPVAMVTYGLLGVGALARRRQWSFLFCWDTLFIGVLILTLTLKNIFHRARPAGAEQFLAGSSHSFPSTHALAAVACFGMIGIALARVQFRDADQRIMMGILLTTLVLLIGTSRLYLGVHRLSEVLAGYAVGLVWLLVCLAALHRASSTASRNASRLAAGSPPLK